MPAKKIRHSGPILQVWGGIIMVYAVALFASLYTYEWRDVSLFLDPPNSPAENVLGKPGAWLAFIHLASFGMGAYLLPIALIFVGLLFLFIMERLALIKAATILLMFLVCVCAAGLMQTTFAESVNTLNIPDTGGFVGRIISDGFFEPVFGTGLAMFLYTIGLLILAALFFEVGFREAFDWIGHIAQCVYRRAAAGVRAVIYPGEWEEDGPDFPVRRNGLYEDEEAPAKPKRRRKPAAKRKPAVEEEEDAPPAKPKRRRKPAAKPAAEDPETEAETEEVAPLDIPITMAGVEMRDDVVEDDASDDEPDPWDIPAPVTEPAVKIVPPLPRKPRKKAHPVKAKPPSAAAAKAPNPDEVFAATSSSPENFELPSNDMLNPMPKHRQTMSRHDVSRSGAILVSTLKEFGVVAELVNAEVGPVVTNYELMPAPGIRVEKIASLSNNLALNLKAESIRVQAPIPGKGVVGIEIPNTEKTMVTLREIMESENWAKAVKKKALPLIVGKDAAGRDIVADLAEMPHLLIAGATGAGKSVCMNSILAGLLMSRSPDELRLMLVDPKIVEFTPFNDLPHLVVPVITDPKKVAMGLRWAITEMEKRYKLFAEVGVRNIKSFNTRPKTRQPELFDSAAEASNDKGHPDTVPYIVIIIDELADLMMVAQAEVENSIARLAQLSRAVGIHMIIATQRPSVNVITGTIKANFPARIAFQVAQKVDSRTILDANGADKLLGKGDMLFLPPGTSRLIRAQGSYTADEEVTRVVDYIKAQAKPDYEVTVKAKLESKLPDIEENDKDSEILESAIEVIRQTRRASTSSLQRRLKIGYNRAARLMDQLEEKGVVGPPQGSEPREILIDLDGEIPIHGDLEADASIIGATVGGAEAPEPASTDENFEVEEISSISDGEFVDEMEE